MSFKTEESNKYSDEHILVCLSAAPSNKKIINMAAKMANAFPSRFTALYVRTGTKSEDLDKEKLEEHIRYAEKMGAEIVMTHGVNIPVQIAEYARLSNVTQIVIGQSNAKRNHFFSKLTLTEKLIEIVPDIDIHISTQANNTNYMTFRFWYEQGIRRVVCARELSLAEIKQIRENIPEDMEIECFIHGAMCISYSGRCLLSNYFTGRDANQGACTHPCRWKYAVVEETRPGEYMPVYENERGTYIFNSKDLCMIEHIPEMVDAGIDSLKIEGRMKTALYVATVARTYRKAIDDYFTSEELYRSHMDWYKEEISKCTYRQFTTGFYFGKPDENTQIYDNNTYVNEYIYLGMIEEAKPEKGLVRITQRNKFCVGDTIEIMKPSGENVEVKVEEMFDGEGNAVESAPHPQQEIWLRLSMIPDVQDILRVGNRKDAMPE